MHTKYYLFVAIVGLCSVFLFQQCTTGQGIKNVRPYELDWAKRFTDDHTPLVDFENLDGWLLETNEGSATWELSQAEMIWGNYTGKLSYQGTPEGSDFVIRPPQPISIPGPFTAANLWVWNNYWKWFGDGDKPRAVLSVLLENHEGEFYEIPFSRELDWPEWYLLHVRLSSVQRKAFEKGGFLRGIRLSNCKLTDETTIYLDNLSFYQETNKPIQFEIEPRLGIDLPVGQSTGVHIGKERLPFPTREETMLPSHLTDDFSTELFQEGNTFIFRYKGSDGILEYRYLPKIGNLGDISAQWMKGSVGRLYPMSGGGVKFAIDNNVERLVDRFGGYVATEAKTVDPDKAELIECRKEGETIVSGWKISKGEESTEVRYVFRLWKKSLVVDIQSRGGKIGEVSLGGVKGAVAPRLLHVPYWTGEDIGINKGRPAVLVMGTQENPLFMTVFSDHYRTGSSRFNFINKIEKDVARCAGGTYYLPKTNGERNDCYERIFLTFSPRFEEILPTVDNPPSKWRDISSEYLVFNRGASKDREKDYKHWKIAARYGLRQLVVMDHEDGWRDGAESFTFRTVPAPAKGGDKGQRKYAKRVQELGMRYGIYNNYTDLVPVNAYWDEDMVTKIPDGSWETAWYRCYAPKSQKVVSMEQKITAEIQRKFNLNAGCLDVHTAITPWMRVDYDERVPGAGTMLSQFYDFGQLMLHQQNVWNGQTFSEGGNHFYYCGLITGSNGEDRGYHVYDEPWLVDFDLLKLHPLGCDVGFAHGEDRSNTDNRWDRFFAGTIAYGHLGKFIDFNENIRSLSLRSYYMLQQLQSSYAKALVKEIRYADKKGKPLDTSTAVATNVYRDSRLQILYDNGLLIWVNGNNEDNWKIPDVVLPPNGYYAKDPEGKLIVFSALINGNRADYVHSPAYDYIDGRGIWVKTPWGACDGKLIVLKDSANDALEVIPFEATQFAITLEASPKSITALDMSGKKIGKADAVYEDGLYSWKPVSDAVSYRVKLK